MQLQSDQESPYHDPWLFLPPGRPRAGKPENTLLGRMATSRMPCRVCIMMNAKMQRIAASPCSSAGSRAGWGIRVM